MSKTKLKIPTTLPEWFDVAALDSPIGTPDVSALFGFATVDSLKRAVRSGAFPKPDYKAHRNYWFKTTLLAEIESRKKRESKYPCLSCGGKTLVYGASTKASVDYYRCVVCGTALAVDKATKTCRLLHSTAKYATDEERYAAKLAANRRSYHEKRKSVELHDAHVKLWRAQPRKRKPAEIVVAPPQPAQQKQERRTKDQPTTGDKQRTTARTNIEDLRMRRELFADDPLFST